VKAGWTYLLHSDGVTKAMRLDELGEAMTITSAAAACEAIRAKVEERGPDDNYTAVVVRALADEPGAAHPDATLPNPGAAARARPGGDETLDRPRASQAARAETRGPFNPPDDVTTRPSPLGPIAAGLAVLALAVGGWGVYAGSQARAAAEASRAEVAALHRSVDSLAARLPADTAGRLPVTAGDSGAAAAMPPAPPVAAPATRTRTGTGR